MKLNQIIAIVAGKKTKAQKLLTAIHHGWREDRLSGISRTYFPKDEDGEVFPPENRSVQIRVDRVISDAKPFLEDFINLVTTQEQANTQAKATITINGKVIANLVPVTVLLFLEKQLVGLKTLVENLPLLPMDKTWSYNQNIACFESGEEETTKTRKIPKVLVKYEATKEHPAQTEVYPYDEVVGRWRTVHFSGSIPKASQEQMLKRVDQLVEAVKIAREEANNQDVVMESEIGKSVLDFIFDL